MTLRLQSQKPVKEPKTTMTGNAVILDTNVVVVHLRNPGKHDVNLAAHATYLPATVLAELYAGAAKSARPDHNRKGIEAFLLTCALLISDAETAKLYGDIWANLAVSGTPIPTNDIWIAASAIQHGMPVITSDAHFKQIPGLMVNSW